MESPKSKKKKHLRSKLKQEITRILEEESDLEILTNQPKPKPSPEEQYLPGISEISQKYTSKMKCLMEDCMDDFQSEIEEFLKKTVEKDLTTEVEDKEKLCRSYFSEKKFSHRNSMLNEMFEKIPEVRTLYNICFAVLVILFGNLVTNDYLENKTIFHYHEFLETFQGVWDCMNMVLIMFCYSIAIIPITMTILHFKIGFFLWGPFYLSFQLYLYYFSTMRAVKENYSFGCYMIVTPECARISMKIHAYIRNKILYCSSNSYSKYVFSFMKEKGITHEQMYVPEIKMESFVDEVKKFVYFWFAPTLLYRDSYPLLKKRDFKNLFMSGFNFFLCIYFGFLLYRVFLHPTMQDFKEKEFLSFILRLIMPSLFCLLLLFYGILHSWFNMWAEILLFPDRQFYEDWWNSLEFGAYYRKWNIVVHEWLYYYMYLDLIRFSNEKISRGISQLLTFLLSAVIHEYIITYSLGFFYPALFILFTGPGVLFIRNSKGIKKKEMNIVFWFLLFIGCSMLIVIYFREYQVRNIISDEKVWEKYGFFTPFVSRSILVITDSDFALK